MNVGDDGRNAVGREGDVGGALAGGRVGSYFEVNGVRTGGGAGKACRHREPIGIGGERVGGAVLVVEAEGQ